MVSFVPVFTILLGGFTIGILERRGTTITCPE